MALRLIEVFVPRASQGAIEAALEDHPTLAHWRVELDEDMVRLTYLFGGEAIGSGVEALQERVDDIAGARVIMMPVEATIPRPDEELAEAEEAADRKPPHQAEEERKRAEGAEAATKQARVTTPELYQDVLTMSELTNSYVGLVVLSTIVAAFGLLNDSIIAIIGAMVIAPLIGPNVGLAMATTLADDRLAAKSAVTTMVGLAAALAASTLMGYWLPVDPTVSTLAGQTVINVLDIGLALAAGAAAVLSLTVGVSTALVGVMVAVALLPPAVAAGMFVGAGFVDLAWRSGLLVFSNVICINLAGVLTFVVQGVRPTQHWEAEQARFATAIAVSLWAILLGVLVYIIWFGVGIDFSSPAIP
jgi:uncharacterized hydrophobic protein (TIGR00341 family)